MSDGLLDLVETALESTLSAQSNVVLRCAVSVLVIDGGVLAQDVAIANTVHLVAGVA
jgi:hypothetical protein